MPRKISQLEAATDVTASDLIQVIDIEDTGMAVTGTNKKCTAQLMANELGKLTNITAAGSTTPRSLANRFADMVNVKDFGAVGDGVADDRPAFVAANAAGKLVFIPKPSVKYKLSSSYVMTSPVFIDPCSKWDQITDGGKLEFLKGHYESSGEGVNIWRFTDRAFVGGVANDYAGGPSPDIGTSWLSSSADGPHYLFSNATLIATPQQRRYGIVGGASTSIGTGAGSAISIGSVLINDAVDANAVPAWAFITEVQHETQDAKSWGIEVALKNASGESTSLDPFGESPTNMTTGILLAGGGDNAFGPSATDPCTAGIVFSTGNSKGWNSGIIFRGSSIPTGDAIQLPYNYRIAWYNNQGDKSAEVISSNNSVGAYVRFSLGANSFSCANAGGKSAFFVETAPTHVNRIQVTSNSTGNQPFIQAAGDDTDIDLQLLAKGTGKIRYGTHTSTSDSPVSGFITIKDASGTTRKLAVIS